MTLRRLTRRLNLVTILAASLLAASAGPVYAQTKGTRSTSSFLKTPTLPDRPPAPVDQYYLPGDPDVDPELGDGVRIQSDEPIRTANNISVAEGRARIEYKNLIIESDRLVIDYTTGDVVLEGNVIYRGVNSIMKGDKGRFNLEKNEGVIYGVDAQNSVMFFRTVWDEETEGPSFVQIDDNQSVYRGMIFTTTNMPVPMLHVKSKEVVLIKGRRMYFNSPVVYIRNTPVFWLPAYSRSFNDTTPWFFVMGYSSDVRAYLRVGYRFIHETMVPGWEEQGELAQRSRGEADVVGDLFNDRAQGAGLIYTYQFEFRRHLGRIEAYGIRDDDRKVYNTYEVVNELEDGSEEVVGVKERVNESEDRWAYRHTHSSRLLGDLYFQMDVDRVSDSDIFVDFYDRFAPSSNYKRGRLFEQHEKFGLAWVDQNWVARVQTERGWRLSRDRYTDFANPWDNDLDFDPDPFFLDGEDFDPEGIPSDRFGLVRDRVMGRFATKLLKVGPAPLYFRTEANAFDAMDSGFNTRSERDDTDVTGGDVFGSVTHRLRLGERTTWLNTVGVGGASYERSDSEIISQRDFAQLGKPKEESSFAPRYVDNVLFQDTETLTLNQDGTTVTTRDIDDQYYFGDFRSRLTHRFTDFLDGDVEYHVREGSENSLGEYYEQIGRLEARNDIYPFYTNQHWLVGRLNYFLRYPNLSLSLLAAQNLDSDDEIYANERTRYASAVVNYMTPMEELKISGGVTFDERQIRDPASEFEFRQGYYGPFVNIEYLPYHARYWAALRVTSTLTTEDDPVDRDVREERRFDEDRTETLLTPTIGRRFGPKYRIQLSGTYTTRYRWWDEVGVTLIRDMHDAELGIFTGLKSTSFEDRRDDSDLRDDEDLDVDYEFEIRGSVRLKVNKDNPGMGSRSITTLSDLRRQGEFVR